MCLKFLKVMDNFIPLMWDGGCVKLYGREAGVMGVSVMIMLV